MPRTLRLAILFSFIIHGILILVGRYRASYDAYVHIFFADHYRMDWWSVWDPRWYTGFFVTSYPPLVHQLMGLLGHLTGVVEAFALILWATLTLLPLSVYSFARIFAGKSVAGYASLGSAFLPSVYLTAHIFGQLPTLAATTAALFGTTVLARYLRSGYRLDLALAIACMGTTMAFHHATLLLLPWLAFAVTLHVLLNKEVLWKDLMMRLGIFGALSVFVMLLVIWPFWDWGLTQSIQSPIDHLSRHNFFKDPLAALLFFLPMYGPLMVIIPSALVIAYKRQLLGPGILFLILFLLGLGDTTPLPRLFFGKGWEWLTYDRFAFWASLILMPFFGIMVILLRRRYSKDVAIKIFSALGTTAIIVGLVTALLPLQPGAVKMERIVNFLKRGDHANWRYLTFGFGDQLALLSTLTTATTMDGSYHTARELPELRASGIAQIDTAFWLKNGLSALDPILQKAATHGVRWGFVNIPQYIPVLERNGWIKLSTLKGGVQVWENPNVPLPTTSQPPPVNPLASFSWGMLPILSFLTALSLGSLRVWPMQAERILRGIHAFLVGLIPLSLCFWYFRTVGEYSHPRIYFTYDHALFFISDALALLAVITWISVRIARSPQLPITNYKLRFIPPSFTLLFSALCLLATLSILWSRDWRTSVYISLHLWLVFLLILSLRDWSAAWKPALLGFCAALSIQIITGVVEFVVQSTAFIKTFGLNWPGPLDPFVRGATVVQLPDGESFLRAYGTLPHPNILGGFAFIFLLGPIVLFMRRERPNNVALLLLIPGMALLALTFSRSAWLAFIIFCSILILKHKFFDRKRLAVFLIVSALSFVLTLLPYRELVQARTLDTTSHAEEFSFIGRAWLNQEALQMIRERPFTGVGIGSFIIQLSQRADEGYVIEPVHNLFLLAAAELGSPGLLLIFALTISVAYSLFKTQNPNAILTGASITGFGIIGLFDHYSWTLAPGRLMLGLVLGLWAGQIADNDA